MPFVHQCLHSWTGSSHLSYRTCTRAAGLGGSGKVNLLITNLGFGERVPVYQNGVSAPQLNAGSDLEDIDFFLDGEHDESARRIGRRTVWAWPFPEANTVARHLAISGDSSVKMGTAPHAWNIILAAMVAALPRRWWRSHAFSGTLARFSEPLVSLTDRFVRETHGMRVDVHSAAGMRVSAVQAHESFRRCVGQSCAEFTMHLQSQHQRGAGTPGVHLTEELAGGSGGDGSARAALLARLTTTPGTLTFTTKGPT